MNKEETKDDIVKQIMESFNTCSVCGEKDKKDSYWHGVWNEYSFNLCKDCSINDLKEKRKDWLTPIQMKGKFDSIKDEIEKFENFLLDFGYYNDETFLENWKTFKKHFDGILPYYSDTGEKLKEESRKKNVVCLVR